MLDKSKLPSFEPKETESVKEIPENFLVDGYLSLTAEGQWLFKGDKIEHKGIQLFLSKQLQRTKEGSYWVVNGPQRVFVELEDAPFIVVYVRITNDRLELFLNDGVFEYLDPTTLYVNEEDILYGLVKKGQAGAASDEGHRARFSREAVFQLEPFLQESNEQIGLKINNIFYPIDGSFGE